MMAGSFASSTNNTNNNGTRHSASVGIHDDPELIQTANELMHRGSSVAEFFETIFPDAWDNFSEEMQELMHRTPMQWSGSGSTVETYFTLPETN